MNNLKQAIQMVRRDRKATQPAIKRLCRTIDAIVGNAPQTIRNTIADEKWIIGDGHLIRISPTETNKTLFIPITEKESSILIMDAANRLLTVLGRLSINDPI